MKKAYVKPMLYNMSVPTVFIPAILGVGMAVGSALGLAASASAAVGGFVSGAALGAAAGGAAALAKKAGNDFTRTECLPSLEMIEAYS
jgi:hypothetical protein